MTSAQLKAFQAVAKYGSFTVAAGHLGLSQPAISDHIKKLETAYATSLFIRQAKGVQLTEVGKKLFAIAERNAETEREAITLLSNAKKLEEGQLTIGADAAVHVIPHIKKFRARFPGISVRLVSGNSSGLIEKLKSFSIDFAVAAKLPEEQGIAAIRIGRDPMVAIVAAKGPLARRKSISLAELAKYPLVQREAGSTTRAMAVQALSQAGLPYGVALEVEGREAAQEAVAHGLGVALVSAGELVHDPRIKSLRLSDCEDQMSEWLLYLEARAGLRMIAAFAQLVA
jgi:LysR family transcriptional regulator, low CO2-responsive transcriptional regulator